MVSRCKITTTLGMSPYEMVFNQKPRKPIMFTANSHKMHKVIASQIKNTLPAKLKNTLQGTHKEYLARLLPPIKNTLQGTHKEYLARLLPAKYLYTRMMKIIFISHKSLN